MKFTRITCSCLFLLSRMAIMAFTSTLRRHIRVHPSKSLQQINHQHHHRLVQFSTIVDSDLQTNSTDSSSNNDRNSSDASSTKTKRKPRATTYPPPPDPSTFPSWSYEPRDFFHFEILHESSKSLARVGRIHTPHGTIDTPSYVAVSCRRSSQFYL